MDLLILRPLLTSILEYFLAWKIWKSESDLKVPATGILFFLATYQLGEFIFFLNTDDNLWAIRFAFAANTLLPALGIFLLEAVVRKNLLGKFIFLFSMVLSAGFVLISDSIKSANCEYCFTKVVNYSQSQPLFIDVWGAYYISVLAFAMFAMTIFHAKSNNALQKKILRNLFISYSTFFPTSVIIVSLFNVDSRNIASIMCGLAVLAAIIIWRTTKLHEEEKLLA